MQRALAVVVALLMAAGGVALVAERRRDGAGRRSSRSVPTTGPDRTADVLRPDQARVTGSVELASFDGASTAPLHLPVTVTAGNRGSTRGRITGAEQSGDAVTITWDGGQPLPISGTGAVDVSGAHLDVRPDGLTWLLDGDARPLRPGHYELGATVAVGTSGLATPRDGTAFDAGPRCVLTTIDGATVHVAPAAVHLEGPGFVDIRGRFELQTAAGTRSDTHVRFGPGSFVVDLTPAGGGWRLQAFLQGPVTSAP